MCNAKVGLRLDLLKGIILVASSSRHFQRCITADDTVLLRSKYGILILQRGKSASALRPLARVQVKDGRLIVLHGSRLNVDVETDGRLQGGLTDVARSADACSRTQVLVRILIVVHRRRHNASTQQR